MSNISEIIREGTRRRDPSFGVGDEDRRRALRSEERRRGGSRQVADTDVAAIESSVDAQLRAERAEQGVSEATPGVVVVQRGVPSNDVLTSEQRLAFQQQVRDGRPVSSQDFGRAATQTAQERSGREVLLGVDDRVVRGSPGFGARAEEVLSSRDGQQALRDREDRLGSESERTTTRGLVDSSDSVSGGGGFSYSPLVPASFDSVQVQSDSDRRGVGDDNVLPSFDRANRGIASFEVLPGYPGLKPQPDFISGGKAGRVIDEIIVGGGNLLTKGAASTFRGFEKTLRASPEDKGVTGLRVGRSLRVPQLVASTEFSQDPDVQTAAITTGVAVGSQAVITAGVPAALTGGALGAAFGVPAVVQRAPGGISPGEAGEIAASALPAAVALPSFVRGVRGVTTPNPARVAARAQASTEPGLLVTGSRGQQARFVSVRDGELPLFDPSLAGRASVGSRTRTVFVADDVIPRGFRSGDDLVTTLEARAPADVQLGLTRQPPRITPEAQSQLVGGVERAPVIEANRLPGVRGGAADPSVISLEFDSGGLFARQQSTLNRFPELLPVDAAPTPPRVRPGFSSNRRASTQGGRRPSQPLFQLPPPGEMFPGVLPAAKGLLRNLNVDAASLRLSRPSVSPLTMSLSTASSSLSASTINSSNLNESIAVLPDRQPKFVDEVHTMQDESVDTSVEQDSVLLVDDEQVTRPVSVVNQDQSSSSGSAQDVQPLQEEEQVVAPIVLVDSSQSLGQEQGQQPLRVSDSFLRQINTPRRPSRPSNPRRPRLPDLPDLDFGLGGSPLGQEFRVVVGKPGQKFFKDFGTGGLDLVNKAKDYVRETPAASFTATPVGRSQGSPFDVLDGSFRLSKTDPFRFVEKQSERINTPGELRGITLEGLNARFDPFNKKGDFTALKDLIGQGVPMRRAKDMLKRRRSGEDFEYGTF